MFLLNNTVMLNYYYYYLCSLIKMIKTFQTSDISTDVCLTFLFLRDYRPEYERLRRQLVSVFVCLCVLCLFFPSACPCCTWHSVPQVEAQSLKQQQQLERLRKDLGAVNITKTPATGRAAAHRAPVIEEFIIILYWKCYSSHTLCFTLKVKCDKF